MRKLLLLLLFVANTALAQNTFKGIVKDEKTGELLTGVSVYFPEIKKGEVTDINGKIEFKNIPDGIYKLDFSLIGYEKKSIKITFPLKDTISFVVYNLESSSEELETITISSTRTNSRIEDVPVKIEVVGQEEIEEMTGINPTNVAMLLTEASGVQQQITSPTSGNVNARIYGLDGSYTQILKDGFPMFSGFSSGFSIMQIPPLDLKQIEIIKGAASSLYGSDAISGVMNLVTKSPEEEADFSIILNQTQKFGSDINGYYSRRYGKFGLSFLATQNWQKPIDVNGDGFTDIPQTQLTTVAPKFYYYFNDSTTLSFLINNTTDTRSGGDIFAIENKPDTLHTYINQNKSNRSYTQLRFDKRLRHGNVFTFKNSVNYFQRSINTFGNNFSGTQLSSYSELSYLHNIKKHSVVIGGNAVTDLFEENKNINPQPRNYSYYTTGLFLQDDWKITTKFIAQTGIRADYQSRYGSFVLPRIALMYKINTLLTARVGSGLGYKSPTFFNTGADQNAYKNVLPIDKTVNAERSIGVNGDVNFKKFWNNLSLSVNEAFFYTQISNPLIPQSDSLFNGVYYYQNASSPIETKGLETNIRIKYKGVSFHTGYTYTDARNYYAKGNQEVLFVAKHRLIMDAFIETKGEWMFGVEGFYTGRQYIGNNKYGRDYWNCALMIAKNYKNIRVLLNAENIFDERQTRHEIVVNSPQNNPTFNPVYMPLNGIIINLSVRIKI